MKSLISCLILAATLVCGAVAPARAYTMTGSGSDSCGAWTANHRAYGLGGGRPCAYQDFLQQSGWLFGFLSGVGSQGINNPLNGTDAEGVLAWIDNYCQAHPLAKTVDAANAFVTAHPRCPDLP